MWGWCECAVQHDKVFVFNDTATTEIYTYCRALSLHDALPICAAPAINPVSPELIARTGAGVAAGLVLSPLAAVIAFIDPGDADAAACGPVLQGADRKSTRLNSSH